MNRLHSIVGSKSSNDLDSIVVDDPGANTKADDKEAGNVPANDVLKEESKPTQDAQAGVQKIEAVTLAWSKESVYTTLILYASWPSLPIFMTRTLTFVISPKSVSGY